MSHKLLLLCYLDQLLVCTFNHFYTVYFGSFGVPWIMFVCMLIYFRYGRRTKGECRANSFRICGLA